MIWRGYRNPLELKDVWLLKSDLRSGKTSREFADQWNREMIGIDHGHADSKSAVETANSNVETAHSDIDTAHANLETAQSSVQRPLKAYHLCGPKKGF